MERDVRHLERLGQVVAQVNDRAGRELCDLESLRGWLREGAAVREKKASVRRAFRWPLLPLAGASVAALALFVSSVKDRAPRDDTPLSFAVIEDRGPRDGVAQGQHTRAGRLEETVSAPAHRPLLVRFSDGSAVALEKRGRARVRRLDRAGALVRLEHGRAHVAIHRRPRARWEFQVGPYEVRVKGTVFELSWEPESRRFAVAVRYGRVGVRGPNLPARDVSAGQIVRATAPVPEPPRPVPSEVTGSTGAPAPAGRTAVVNPVGKQPTGDNAGLVREQRRGGATQRSGHAAVVRHAPRSTRVERLEPPPRPAVPIVAARPASSTRGKPPKAFTPADVKVAAKPSRFVARQPSPEVTSRLRRLVRTNRYGEAVRLARRVGWRAVLKAAPVDLLLELGDAARLLRDGGAADLYHAVRLRARGRPASASAAYALGQLAFDGRGAAHEAARWFAEYLRLSPGGVLAREAEGRLIEARAGAGDVAGAKRAARGYLKRHPRGPHAALARRLLAGTERTKDGAPP